MRAVIHPLLKQVGALPPAFVFPWRIAAGA